MQFILIPGRTAEEFFASRTHFSTNLAQFRKHNGSLRVCLKDLATKLGQDIAMALQQVRSVVGSGVFGCETVEEGLALRFPRAYGFPPEDIEGLIRASAAVDDLRLRKFDFIFAAMRLSSSLNVEFLFAKLKNSTKSLALSKPTDLFELLVQYINLEHDDYEIVLKERDLASTEVFPFAQISTQRDRTTLLGDFAVVLRELKDLLLLPDPTALEDSLVNKDEYRAECILNLVRITQGISKPSFESRNLKDLRFWEKHMKYNTEELLKIAAEALENHLKLRRDKGFN
eukprot:TRINITY_DN12632_c0_g1_i3.p1 TRINITY_DN12632_c0_g1~~TRINITY_DN12632_c0_g1_i3.p1  ORF type:complete len:286 (+),score=39.46 TRINITY_DN12632_c0_g1_i3:116-973(+)